MTDASLNDIYRQIGELIGSMKGLVGNVADLKIAAAASEESAAEYRQGVRDELGKIVLRTTHLETDMSTVKESIEKMRGVTDDVVKMRERALGAGTAGNIVIKIGVGVVGMVGWVAWLYTYLTGRPPP